MQNTNIYHFKKMGKKLDFFYKAFTSVISKSAITGCPAVFAW